MKYYTENILIDASVLIAYLHKEDIHHAQAKIVFEDIARKGHYVIEHVFDEVLGVIHRKYGKEKAKRAGEMILGSRIQIIFTGMEEFIGAWEIFKEHDALSYTDAVLCAVMENSDFASLATFDKQFEKLGVNVIN